jgi:hypothetical protein
MFGSDALMAIEPGRCMRIDLADWKHDGFLRSPRMMFAGFLMASELPKRLERCA